MHGVIFTSLREYVIQTAGAVGADAVFAGEPSYLLGESYPDERFLALVGRSAEATGIRGDEFVHGFGLFAARHTFVRLYPAFFAIAPSAREFLLTVETRIHELVRATIPNARPPQLAVTARGESELEIRYSSGRRLCVLLRGLAEGTAAHYAEKAELTEETCMRRGDAECRFRVVLTPR